MANLINESEIRDTWSPIIESATGINDSEKLAWMSQYCHNHKLYEDANIMSLAPTMNIQGMGATTLPIGMGGNSGGSGTDGSGDKLPSLLPLAMQVAAQTIGLDLVPVVPMAGPMGILSYLDFTYAGGRLDADGSSPTYGSEAPLYVKATAAGTGADIAASSGNYAGYRFVGTSRIDGKRIFEVTSAIELGSVELDLIAAAAVSPAQTVTAGSVALVKALEDHILSAAGKDVLQTATADPYNRQEGESTKDKLLGLTLYSKSVAAETFQIAAAVTREQVQDLKQFGVDAVAQVESVLTNELSQSINNLILGRIKALGTTNATNAGITLGGNLAASPTSTRPDEINRRIATNILAAANMIANRGRRGAGNFAVCNVQVATALQSSAGFAAAPMANTISQAAGSIYPVGSIAGVNVYVDPNKAWTDLDITVGRKGDGNGPGLVFMPYLMAESVQTIAEGTMAPKVAVKSRFALVEAGQNPETQYWTFSVSGLAL
jgi:hypothetical protein